jgi:hypothetical protein
MKSSNHKNLGLKAALLLWAAMASGALVMAQPTPGVQLKAEVKESYDRLDALMASTEQAIQYVAPMEVYDDIRSVWDRLELLAETTEHEIRYSAPDELEEIGPVYLLSDYPSETSHLYTIPNLFINLSLPALY